MPTGEPAHKEIDDDPGKDERRMMTELAARGAEWLSDSGIELDRPGPTYTVDTLRQLRTERPEDEIVWILGADQAVSLPDWREPEEVMRLGRVAVARRDGLGEREEVTTFEMPSIDVSSTMVRERVAARQPYAFLVPERVAHHIDERGLYRGGGR
jgi:nicotinate-nucleotide adenylyltransferase